MNPDALCFLPVLRAFPPVAPGIWKLLLVAPGAPGRLMFAPRRNASATLHPQLRFASSRPHASEVPGVPDAKYNFC